MLSRRSLAAAQSPSRPRPRAGRSASARPCSTPCAPRIRRSPPTSERCSRSTGRSTGSASSETPLRTPAPASLAGQTIGAYTLISQIGQGGMGSVWLARRSDGRFEGQVGRQAPERESRRPRRRGAVPARGQHPGPAASSAHRAAPRRGCLPGRPALSRARARRRRADRPLLRRNGASASRPACASSSTSSRPSPTLTPT